MFDFAGIGCYLSVNDKVGSMERKRRKREFCKHLSARRELSSGIWCFVALVRTDVSEECITSIRVFLRRVLQLLVTANVFLSSPILVTLMMEAILFVKRRFLQELHGVTSRKTAFVANICSHVSVFVEIGDERTFYTKTWQRAVPLAEHYWSKRECSRSCGETWHPSPVPRNDSVWERI
jgi:hypothetical protein